MNTVERVKEILKEKRIPVSKMERDLGFSNGYISQLRRGTLPADRLTAIANYLNVDRDYLIYGDEWLAQYGGEADDDLLEYEEELQIMKDDPSTRSLLRSSKGLTGEQIEAVRALMKTMRRSNGVDDS